MRNAHKRLRSALRVVAVIFIGAGAAPAQDPDLDPGWAALSNWLPGTFELVCGQASGPLRPAPPNFACFPGNSKAIFESHLGSVLSEYRSMGLWSPDGFGPVIDAYEVPGFVGPQRLGKRVRVFGEGMRRATASITRRCSDDVRMWMKIDPAKGAGQPEWGIAKTSGHELHHAVKNSAVEDTGCDAPKWIFEGIADSFAFEYSRRQVPSAYPISGNSFWKKRAVGLRRYDLRPGYEFQYDSGGRRVSIPGMSDAPYRTSSLWNFLSNRFHGGSLKFTRAYIDRIGKADWKTEADALRWLDRQLRADPNVPGDGLYTFYPAFLTDFTALWDSGDFPESYTWQTWLTEGFGGCERVQLSPAQPYTELDVEVRPIAGRCFQVEITGLSQNATAAVKVGAVSAKLDIADSLHLGLAFTSDASGFNCARAAREKRISRRLFGCVIEPVTGAFEQPSASVSAARFWLGNMLEPGLALAMGRTQAGAQTPGTGGSVIENTYVLSFVPPSLDDIDFRPKPVKLLFGLEIATLSVNGGAVAPTAADPARERKQTRAMGGVGGANPELDLLMPYTTGYIDTEGVVESMMPGYSEMQQSMADIGAMARGLLPPDASAFSQVVLTDAVVDQHGLPFNVKDSVANATYYVGAEGIAPGVTGSFAGMAYGQDPAMPPHHTLFSPEESPARITVLENSASVYRARVEAELCEYDMLSTRKGGPHCLRRVRISGSITKPFAFLYRPGGTLRSLETPGEKILNGSWQRGVRDEEGGGGGGPPPGVGGPGAPSGGGGGGSGGGGGGAAESGCDCSCPSGGTADRAILLCGAVCATEWAQCAAPPVAGRE